MSAPGGQTILHCRDCGRVASHAGNACAFCGGPLLATPVKADRPVVRKHSQILAASVTFCLGLLLVRVLLGVLRPGRFPPLTSGDDPLVLLEMVAAGGTVLYMVLRGEEGDFRALFLVSLMLFMGQEAMSFVAGAYGLMQFTVFALVAAFATTVFSSLGLITYFYENVQAPKEAHRGPMLAGSGAICALSFVRSLTPMIKSSVEKYVEIGGIVVLIAMLAYLANWLFRPRTPSIAVAKHAAEAGTVASARPSGEPGAAEPGIEKPPV
ncbi:MAG: hypothetical protein HY291_17885 [Planctomycetes bacterium]|nr:hypothetical protein [Planctomycetota bacterium]